MERPGPLAATRTGQAQPARRVPRRAPVPRGRAEGDRPDPDHDRVRVIVAVIAGANNSSQGQAPPPAALGFPPATLAGGDFTAAGNARGINQVLSGVASDGAEIVAVGSQQGARIARAQFFVSTDDGRSWAMGAVRALGGGPPPPGSAARFVAAGPGGWIAIGPGSIWTSPNGLTWTLASTAGLPRARATRSACCSAPGWLHRRRSNVPGGNQAEATPVLFLSADGLSWRRLGAGSSVWAGRRQPRPRAEHPVRRGRREPDPDRGRRGRHRRPPGRRRRRSPAPPG